MALAFARAPQQPLLAEATSNQARKLEQASGMCLPMHLTMEILSMPSKCRAALVAVALFVTPGLRVASAQTTTVCRAAGDDSENMMTIVKQYALATDSTWKATRDSLRIPAVSSASSVVLITKENTCKSASSAYQSAVAGARQTLSGRVYVVQVGTSYVVWDPAYVYNVASPMGAYAVFDSRWGLKRIFVP
jgi:hypothetical protein